MNTKYFLITVDTEGDNLWDKENSQTPSTENSKYIERFQLLCEKYNFLPTYFTNYEMAQDETWIDYGRKKAKDKKCEIGLHIHAWNNPPEFALNEVYGSNSYITEYPHDIAFKKISMLKEVIETNFDVNVTSARSGRWATDNDYFSILKKLGIRVDCSVTPQIDLSGLTGFEKKSGNDYFNYPTYAYYIHEGIVEVPMSTRNIHRVGHGSIKRKARNIIKGDSMWLRPHTKSFDDLLLLTKKISRERNHSYLEFMMHSSEFMPGGSPYFKNETDIESMYDILERYFDYITECGYVGCTVTDYAINKTDIEK